ncbi:MAG: HAD-IA family hydrolase [Patescibacteria group bacterium]
MINLIDYLKTHPKKYIIFDLDETLAKLKIDWSTYQKELWELVKTFDNEIIHQIPCQSGMGIKLSNLAIKKHGNKAKSMLDGFTERYEVQHYSGYIAHKELLAFIRLYQNKYIYFIWTSNMKKTIQDFLYKEHLHDFFQKIITRSDVSLLKPEPDGFAQIYIPDSLLSDYLFIGDNARTDKAAAQKAGIDFFQIDHSF